MKNYYEVLGVAESATQDEIKAQYRKMAKKWHPDVNKDKKDAEAKFKEVQEAYSAIGDEQSRKAYDDKRHGRTGLPGFNFDINFDDFFKQGFGRSSWSAPRRGRDMRATVQLSLEDVAFGCTKTLTFRRSRDCEDCLGLGGTMIPCQACGGRGTVTKRTNSGGMVMQYTNACSACTGRGSRMEDPCNACRGSGKKEHDDSVSVSVPVGASSTDVIKIRGKGEQGPGEPGDLLVIVMVKPHPRFTRNMNDLLTTAKVPFKTVLSGGEFGIIGLRGDVYSIKVPKACQYGHVVSIPGAGIAGGEMKVSIEYDLPNLDEKALEKVFAAL